MKLRLEILPGAQRELLSRLGPIAAAEGFYLAGSGHVLVSLAYFDDAEGDPDPRILNGLAWPEIKRRLVGWVKELSAP